MAGTTGKAYILAAKEQDLFNNTATCNLNDPKISYGALCTNGGDWGLLKIESGDTDKTTRKIGPLTVKYQ